jgi:hypothetical protein
MIVVVSMMNEIPMMKSALRTRALRNTFRCLQLAIAILASIVSSPRCYNRHIPAQNRLDAITHSQ